MMLMNEFLNVLNRQTPHTKYVTAMTNDAMKFYCRKTV